MNVVCLTAATVYAGVGVTEEMNKVVTPAGGGASAPQVPNAAELCECVQVSMEMWLKRWFTENLFLSDFQTDS